MVILCGRAKIARGDKKQNPRRASAGISLIYFLVLNRYYVGGLQTFGAFFDGELHPLTLNQIAVTIGLDGREMDEDVLPTLALDEAVTFAAVKPLDRSDYSFRHFTCLLLQVQKSLLRGSCILLSDWSKKATQGNHLELPS